MNNLFNILNNFLFRKKEEKPIKLYNTDNRHNTDSRDKVNIVKDKNEEVKEAEVINKLEENDLYEEKEIEIDLEDGNQEKNYTNEDKKKLEEIFEPLKFQVLKELIEESKDNNIYYQEDSDDNY